MIFKLQPFGKELQNYATVLEGCYLERAIQEARALVLKDPTFKKCIFLRNTNKKSYPVELKLFTEFLFKKASFLKSELKNNPTQRDIVLFIARQFKLILNTMMNIGRNSKDYLIALSNAKYFTGIRGHRNIFIMILKAELELETIVHKQDLSYSTTSGVRVELVYKPIVRKSARNKAIAKV